MEVRDNRGRFIKGNVPRNKKGQCVHHWMIDNNNVGTCKKCGEVRDFGVLLTEKSKRLSERQAEIARDVTHGKRRGRPPALRED